VVSAPKDALVKHKIGTRLLLADTPLVSASESRTQEGLRCHAFDIRFKIPTRWSSQGAAVGLERRMFVGWAGLGLGKSDASATACAVCAGAPGGKWSILRIRAQTGVLTRRRWARRRCALTGSEP